MFLPSELIKKKRDGGRFSADEVKWLIEQYTAEKIPDYQMSALLMAVFFRGLNDEETAHLTLNMMRSGRVLDFSKHLSPPHVAVDKHSTGGVGDKTTLLLGPIAAAAGVSIPMIAGRGLGHTGGTLDKLESIPGFKIDISVDDFERQVLQHGLAMIGQTSQICPADKKLYALRDVTGTVDSIPLICASIMSKKLAEGIGALVLDVKWGSGAFMKTHAEAKKLASSLVQIGAHANKRVVAVLSDMNQVLGQFVGNSLEIGEAVAVLRNASFLDVEPPGFTDTRALSLELASLMIWLSGKTEKLDAAREIAHEVLVTGKAYDTFLSFIARQGGRLAELPLPKFSQEIKSSAEGFVCAFSTEKIGLASLVLGAGRKHQGDIIEPSAGIRSHRKIGDAIRRNEVLFTLYSSDPRSAELFSAAQSLLTGCVEISPTRPQLRPLITESIGF